MRHESWTCNLCGEKRDKFDVYTMYHTGCAYVIVAFGHPKWSEADKHVCKECVRIIRETKA